MVFPRSQSSRWPPPKPPSHGADQQDVEDKAIQHLRGSTKPSFEVGSNRVRGPNHAGFATFREGRDAVSQPTTLIGFDVNQGQAWSSQTPEAFSKTVKGGNSLVPSIVQAEENNEHTEPQFWKCHPFSQSGMYATAAPQYMEFAQESIASSGYTPADDGAPWLFSQPDQHAEAHFGTLGHLGFPSVQTWKQTEAPEQSDSGPSWANRTLQSPVVQNETMKDFIERIEAETLLNWDETRYLQQEGNSFEGDPEAKSKEVRYDARDDSEDIDMASFWRPNWFM
ncbi:hypothetical protein QQZ08_007141 [Neonectria magnoliae]|uniref:Uncharacterized protein n=1 Tax=Neonectria magnoliae TaxID=2732573 RepID=A0ABR1HZ39_9HYPO